MTQIIVAVIYAKAQRIKDMFVTGKVVIGCTVTRDTFRVQF